MSDVIVGIFFAVLTLFLVFSTTEFWINSTSDRLVTESKVITIGSKTYQCKPVIVTTKIEESSNEK